MDPCIGNGSIITVTCQVTVALFSILRFTLFSFDVFFNIFFVLFVFLGGGLLLALSYGTGDVHRLGYEDAAERRGHKPILQLPDSGSVTGSKF